ncbi:hypothetical protein GTA62_19695 [Roseobacter sp. HKCCD9010]|uniref:hypothetical protein n=1 Tax=unclassified Roseobacter TaxID=196798 RepID=UPI0014918C9C|nr:MULTISPECIES: hypothetical protein [unclassified Roseobacter]MBF9052188.1 hypothetical protein [Rhodobacterales bacterium HKCCD4356]NNV14143.1 hypothetical protein [Roseobacter sp. HKCCD7357]NNV18367.1 hypothetical protein [Roseobacter sp. HKCCD8768]NNV27807.1 hypothetical protein [Roseobacter sp. HKCCD8192]NNV32089.1 hypothetical protein [Roseobacter sp. HKCCD9061]
MLDRYLIVGRQAENGRVKYLHDDGSIDETPEKEGVTGTPLTVELIGEVLVELSQTGPLHPADPLYRDAVRKIHGALMVVPEDGHDPNDPELDRILEATEVRLDWDTRVKVTGDTDRNTRTLVVPVAETLAWRQDLLSQDPKGPGFEPPLTYELDLILMRAHFSKLISGAIGEMTGEDGQPLTDALKERLIVQFDDLIGSFETYEQQADNPARQRGVDVLRDPVTAFHRAVGIYITNMCN